MALEGTIKDFGLPDIFQLIGLQRKTGLLTLKNEKEQVTVTFENGMVVMADSSAKRLEDRLGNVLVKQGKLSKERLDEALSTQKATLQRMGHILTTGNYITVKDLKDALQVQVSQIVFKVFRWRDGEYHFEPAEAVDYDRDNFNPMSADFILMEGIRMVDEWPIIEKKIPSMDIVLRPVVDPSMIEVSASAEDGVDQVLSGLSEGHRSAASSFSKIRLTPEEERVYRKVDGTRTVQAIIDATGVGEFEVCRVLFDLLNRNIISTVGRGEAREALSGQVEAPPSSVPTYLVLAVVAALSLAAIWARLATPFSVAGQSPFLSGTYQMLLDGVSRGRLDRLDRAIQAYRFWRGTVPRTLEELVAAGIVDRSYLKDPWERPFHYALTDNGYLLNAVDDRGKADPTTVIERHLPPDRP
jgi:predicted transcriptional regulator